jgi:hypothetical protein
MLEFVNEKTHGIAAAPSQPVQPVTVPSFSALSNLELLHEQISSQQKKKQVLFEVNSATFFDIDSLLFSFIHSYNF